MTAVVYQLPGTRPAPAAAAEVADAAQRSATARWGLDAAVAIVRRMLDSADDTLFGMAERTASDEERRNLFDSMRMLRKHGQLILDAYGGALMPRSLRSTSQQVPVALALLDDQSVEDGIHVSRIVSRIENVATDALWEYAVRIDNVPVEHSLREQFELLRPMALAGAFRDAMRAADVEASTYLILFKLYERQFLVDACPFYLGLNERMEAEGYSGKLPPRRGAGTTAAAAPVASDDPVHPSAGGGASFPRAAANYSLPASLRALLSGGGSEAGVAGPGGAAGAYVPVGQGSAYAPAYGLAHGPAHGPSGGSALPLASLLGSEGGVQRLSLVSQLLDEIGRDWKPGELAALRRLVLPLAGVAVGDARFFGDAHHPARELLSSLGGLAADDGARDRGIGEVEHLLQSMQQGIGPQAVDAGPLQPLAPSELLQFLTELRRPRNSTEARVAQARAAAHQQVKAVGSGRDLPEGIAAFLTDIWLPMVGAVYLRFGADSPEWTTTNELLERLFTQCRWLPTHDDPGLVDDILEDVGSSLQRMAVPPKLIDKARSLLRDGLGSNERSKQLLDLDSFRSRKRGEARVPSPQPSPAAAASPAPAKLAACPGSSEDWRAAVPVCAWFRVYDRAGDRTAWLTAEVLYPQASGISFVGFDPSVQLTVDREDFLDDLVAGKAEPVYPTEAQQAAISRLCGELAAARRQR